MRAFVKRRYIETERKRAEADAKKKRLDQLHQRLKKLNDDIQSKRKERSELKTLNAEEREIFDKIQREQLALLIEAIDQGEVPPNAIDDLNQDERTLVMELILNSNLTRRRAPSDRDTQGLKFADKMLEVPYYNMMQLIGNTFKYVKDQVKLYFRAHICTHMSRFVHLLHLTATRSPLGGHGGSPPAPRVKRLFRKT